MRKWLIEFLTKSLDYCDTLNIIFKVLVIIFVVGCVLLEIYGRVKKNKSYFF